MALRGRSYRHALVREQAAWNRQHLAQGRARAWVSAWLDTREYFRGIGRQ